MRAFLTIFTRQLRDGQMALWVALLLGFVAWSLTYLPQAKGLDPTEIRGVVALTISWILVAIAAVALGVGLYSRELLEGRLAFFYARPIGVLSLWCGRLGAALVLLAITAGIVWTPALLSGGSPNQAVHTMLDLPEQIVIFESPRAWVWGEHPWAYFRGDGSVQDAFRPWLVAQQRHIGSPWLWAAAAAALLLLFSHIVAVSLRVRSGWLAMDIGAAIVSAGLIISTGTRLASVGAWGALLDLVVTVVVGGLTIAALVILTQLAVGRTVPRRFHAAGSIVLGLSVLMGSLIVVLRAQALINSGAEDLTADQRLIEAPEGGARILAGPVDNRSGFVPVFVVDDAAHGTSRIGTVSGMPAAPMFSGNGRVLAWRSCRAQKPSPWRRPRQGCHLLWLDLDVDAPPTAINTPRPNNRRWQQIALDYAGHQLAHFDGRTLVVRSMPSNKIQHAVAFDTMVSKLAFEETESGEVLQLEAFPHPETYALDSALGQIVTTEPATDQTSP